MLNREEALSKGRLIKCSSMAVTDMRLMIRISDF